VRLALPALAAAVAVAAGAGCGGGEGEDPAAAPTAATTSSQVVTEDYTPRPTAPADQTRWASAVDDVCRPWQKKIDAIPPPADADALAAWLDKTLPLVRKQVAAVEAVTPPAQADEAARVTRFVAELRKIEESLSRYRHAFGAGDQEAIQRALADANAAGAKAREQALALDVTQCGGYAAG
jgi:hypothetical protein